MDFDAPNIIAMVVFSGVGFVYFSYGKRMTEPRFMLSGAALFAYSYFTPSIAWTVGLGLLISAVPFISRFVL